MKILVKLHNPKEVEKFVEITNMLESDVLINNYKVDGKSLMGILSLDLSKKIEVELLERDFREKDSFLTRLYENNITFNEDK